MIETKNEGKRKHLLFFTMIGDNRLFHIDIEGNALKRIGTAVGFINPDYCVVLSDRNDPEKSIHGDGWKYLPSVLSNCLYLPNVLDYLFGVTCIDKVIDNNTIIFWRDPRTNRICYKLAIKSSIFETNATCLLYDLVSALMTAEKLSFNFFIGEYDNRTDTDGIRKMESTFFEGGKQLCDQKATRSTDLTYRSLLPYKYPSSNSMTFGLVEGAISFTGYIRKGKSYYGTRAVGKGNITSLWLSDESVYTIECNNNAVFCGHTKNGTKSGWGIAMMSNGCVACGWWEDNSLNGQCINYSTIGTVYRGYLFDKEFTSLGEMRYRNYSYYEGEWKSSQYDKYGLFILTENNENKEKIKKYSLRYWRYGKKSDIIYQDETEKDLPVKDQQITKQGLLWSNVKRLVRNDVEKKTFQHNNS